MIDDHDPAQGTESDQDAIAAVAAGLAQCRDQYRAIVHQRIAAYAELIKLSSGTEQQFEADVVEALLWCVVIHKDAPNRKRYSGIRKQLMGVNKQALAAQKHLEQLRGALNDLPPQYRELLNAHVESVARIAITLVAKQAPWFHALSSVACAAGAIAKALSGADKGGAPTMLAFKTLVSGLIRAFERATGRQAKVTWHEHRGRFEGDFIKLVEAVLPLAKAAAGAKPPLKIPETKRARGSYIRDMTRRPRARKPNT